MKYEFVNIPDALKKRDQWVLWRREDRDGDVTKVPYRAGGSPASTTDPTTWTSFSKAQNAYVSGGVDGIGFVFKEDGPFVGIDLDGCVDGADITGGALDLVDRLDSYTEGSPSGTGLHIICRGFLPDLGNRTSDVQGMKELEMYESGRYFTFTGRTLDNAPDTVEQRAKDLHALCEEVFGEESNGQQSEGVSEPLDVPGRDLVAEMRDRDGKLDRLMSGDTSGYKSHSEAQQALANKLAFYLQGDDMEMEEVFKASDMCRGDDDVRKFSEYDVATALDSVDEFYDPSRPSENHRTNGHAEKDCNQTVSASNTGPFWYLDESEESIKIDRSRFIRFLEKHGFGKTYVESDLESRLVRVQDNVVEYTSAERIKDFTLRFVREKIDDDHGLPLPASSGQIRAHGGYSAEDVSDALLRGANVYFSSGLFEFLEPLDLDFHRDTAEKAFFYYQNGFVEVTAEGFTLHDYSELDGAIWKDQIIDREFVDLTDEPTEGWDWHEHLLNVAGREKQRHTSLCTALGYLQHGYKDPAVTKAVILMDEKDTDVEEGRTGKSLTAKALQETSPTLRIDGRNFSFDSQFAFQQAEVGTQIIDFNDVRERFPFERLFSVITDDFPIERKNEDRVTIEFEDSPKFLLSTNYVIGGRGASFEDRTFQVEFADYYGTDHTPVDEFGHRLFDEWEDRQWHEFDNVMMACVRLYLRDGLVGYEHVNVDYRRLKQHTCPDFAEWAVGFIEPGEEYEKEALWRTFREAYDPDYEDLSRSKFGYWLNDFARVYELDKQQRQRRKDGTRKRYVTFKA